MQLIHKTARVVAICVAAIGSTAIASACRCPSPPPPLPGTPPSLRLPSLDDNSAVFVGVVEDVYPKGFAAYEKRWRQIYHQDLAGDKTPSVNQFRQFVLKLWPDL